MVKMNMADYKLGDLYPGYSAMTTRDYSTPEPADQEVTGDNVTTNNETIAVAEMSKTNSTSKGILGAIGVIIGIAIVVGFLH